MKKAVLQLRSPIALLILSICGSLLAVLSLYAWFLFTLAIIFLCFRLRNALILCVIFIVSIYIVSHCAFVLDIKYGGKEITYITTKGYHKGLKADRDIAIGDLLWGSFESSLQNKFTYRLKYRPEGEFRAARIPFVSALLEKRQTQASYLLYSSGGIINTAPTHVFAVRDNIPNSLNDMYIITGLAHLLSMSGFHVGIFIAGFFVILAFLPLRVRLIPIIILLPLLIPLSGFAITVIRATVFGMVYLAATSADLKVKNLHFLALLAALILMFSPFSLYSISFLLSFFAVFGIMILFKQRYNSLSGIVYIGIASTVFTLPIQLYFFGTSNVLSVFTTAIMTPVVWMQMALAMLSLIMPSISIAPLAYTERFAEWLMAHITDFTWNFMYVAKPPTFILIVSFIIAFSLCFTRFRLASLLILLMPLLPIYPKNIMIFPELPPSPKGYVYVTDNSSEIFYQGMHSSFVRHMVPAAAKLGVKRFDYGSVRIFDGANLYLRIKNNGMNGKICINEFSESCEYVYCTRSNTIKPPLPENTKLFVIYNNKYREDDRIIVLSETGEYQVKME